MITTTTNNNRITRFAKLLLLVLAVVLLSNFSSMAQSFRTVTFSGSSADFNAAEKITATGSAIDYYITFDATNLYLGAFNTSGNFGGTDNFTVYIDSDPNSTPTGGVGTTAGQSYNGVTGTLPFSANYNVHAEQGYQEARSFGSSWAATISGVTYNTGSNWREVKIPLSSIGTPDALYLTMWMGYSGGFFANAPGANIAASGNPTIVNYFGGIGVSSADCIPVNITNTPITATVTNAIPASGAVIGKLVINTGSITASNNFTIAPGGSIQLSGSATLTISSRTITMGGATIGTGRGTTINIAGTATLTGNSSTILTFNGEGNWTGNAYSYPGTININRKFTPMASGGLTLGSTGLLQVKASSFVNTNSLTYATGSTLSFQTGATYSVGTGDKTWGIGASGVGVPDKVLVNLASTNVTISENRTARSTVTVTLGTLTNNTNTLDIATGITTGATALSINGGTLTNAGGTINVGVANGGNQAMSITASGVVTLSSGTINLNGNGVFSSGTFTMTNGNFNIDPNSGTLATSVASGTAILNITSVVMAVSGGTITFVDPPNAGTAKTLTFSSTSSYSMVGNTIVVGGASGTNTTTATVGFAFDTYVSSGRLQLGTITVAGGNTTDRYMSGAGSTADEVNIGGNITINAGSELRIGASDEFHFAGNIINNGTLTSLNTNTGAAASAINFERQSTPTSNTVAQTVSGSGTFRNSTSASTAKFSSLTFDNTAASPAVTFSIGDVTVSNATSFVNGVIDIGNNNSFTYVGTGVTANRTNGYVLIQGTGEMKKAFATGSSSFTFHVGENTGTTEYSPAFLSFTALTPASTIGVRPVDGATASTGHPNLNDVDAQTDYISRWWQVSNSAATTYTYTGTFTYLPADINGTEGNMLVNMWSGASPWKQVSSSAASNVLTISSGANQATCPLGATADFTGRVKAPVTYTWNHTGTGDYPDASRWTPNRTTPGSNDILVFDGTITPAPTVKAIPTETIGKLIFINSANVTFESSAPATLTISGGTGTDLDIPSGSHLQIGSNPGGSINLAFIGSQTASIAGQLSLLSNSSNNNTYTATNSTTTVTGTINSIGVITSTTSNLLITTGTYRHLFTTTNGTIPTATWSSTSTCSIQGYTTNTTIPSGTAQTFGNFTWNTPNQNTGSINLVNNIVAITGNFTVIATGTTAARELRMGGTGSTTLPISGNLNIQGGVLALTSSTGTQTYTVAGGFSQSGGTIDFASGNGATTLKVAGTFNQVAGTLTETSTGNGTIEFNGASSQSVTISGTISNTINVRVLNPAGIAITGTLPMNAGTTFTAAAGGTAVTSGTVTYSTTTTLAYVTALGTQITGNEFPSSSGPVNVTFNNTNAARTITLSASRTITGTLTLTGGRVTLGAFDLTLANGGTLTATSPSATNMIVTDGAGLFKRGIPATTGTYLFPIGDVTGTAQYSPVSLQFTANSTIRVVGAKVFDASSSNINSGGTPTNFLSRYWTFSEDGSGGTYNYYINPALAITGAEDENGTASLIKAAYWDGSVWTSSTGSYTAGSLVSNATGVSETAAPLGSVEWTGRDNPAVSYTWVGFTDGTWNTASNWNPSGIPSSSDAVTLTNGSTGVAANLSLTGSVSVNALTFNGTGNFFTIGASATLSASGNITYTAGTGTWDATSTFVISSAVSQTIPAFNYGNLTGTGGARVWTSGTTGIAGTFTPGAGVYTATSGSTVDYTSAGAQSIASVNYYDLSNSGNGARTLLTGTIDVANTYTPTTAATTPGSSNVFNFSSASAQTIPTTNYYSITNTGNGNRTLATSGANSNVITIANLFTPGSGTYTTTNSTIEYTGATTFTLAAFPYYNLILNSTGAGTWNLASGITLAIANDLTLAGTSTSSSLNISNTASTCSLTVAGNCYIQSRGILRTISIGTSTGGVATITGNLEISGTGKIHLESVSAASGTGVINVNGNFTSTGTTVASVGANGVVDFGAGSSLANNGIFIKGNFSHTTAGTFGTGGTGPNLGFVFNGTAPQSLTYTGAAVSDYTNYQINSGATVNLASNLTFSGAASPSSSVRVLSGGTLNMADFVIANSTGGSGTPTFDAQSGSTLGIGSADGIRPVGATLGNVRISSSTPTGVVTYSSGANYVYNGVVAQATGTGLPATINTLKINNVTNAVTLTAIVGITSATNSLILQAGTLDLNNKQLTIPVGGTVASTGGDFTATAGPVFFLGTGTVSGTVNFPTVTIAGGVVFGAGSNIVTSLQINSGGFVNTTAPTYGSSSTLIYNTGGSYGRGLEWSATSGAGYPNHVQVSNSTSLDVGNAAPGVLRQMAGNLTIDASSGFYMDFGSNDMTQPVVVLGNINIAGGLSLSDVVGGDLKIRGNWTHTTGTFAPKSRAVFFDAASGNQTITATGGETFDFLILDKAADNLVLANDITVTQTLTLTSGLVSTASNSVTIGSGGATASASSASYVSGIMKKVYAATGTFTFPIGKGGVYRPLGFEYTALTGTSTVTTEQFESALSGTLPANTNLNSARYWDISQTGGSGLSYKVTLDGTGDYITGTVVMLKNESGTITSNTSTTPNYTNSSAYSGMTGTVSHAIGSSCSVGRWLGYSSDWFSTSNWCGGSVPTASTDVTIENGATVYPIIVTSAAQVKSISIASAATLTVNSGSLTMAGAGDITDNGALTIGASGTLNMVNNLLSGTGTVVINGTLSTQNSVGLSGGASTTIVNTITSLTLGAASTIDYASVGPQDITAANYANLSNSGNGDRTLANSGTIGISATFTPGSGAYIASGSTLEFNGTVAQSIPAILPDSKYDNLTINNAAGVAIAVDLSIEGALTLTSGTFTTTGKNFTLLSTASKTARIAPVTGGTITGDIIMERFVPGGVAGWATICAPVSGATLAQWNDDIATSGFTGSTYGPGIFNSIYTYNEAIPGLSSVSNAYIQATNVTNSIDPTKGYFVFIDMASPTVADKLLDVKGPPLIGSQDLNVTFTSSVGGANEDGWNLVANPYASAINWNAGSWTKTNMDNSFYIYEANSAQYKGISGGVSYNGGGATIASSQAFLVHAYAASPSLIADENIKVASNPTFYKESNVGTGILRLQLDGLNGTYFDETVFHTDNNATSNFDPAFDGYKLYSLDPAAPNISSKLNGIEYVVNTVGDLNTNLDLPVRVNVNTAGSYTINFIGLQEFANVTCFSLEDKLTNTWVDLKMDSTYTFTSQIDTASASPRFVLHFGVENIVPQIMPSATTVSFPGSTNVDFANLTTGATSYSWDFGDGSPLETVVSPSHVFDSVGTYVVTMIATNAAGCSVTSTVTINVDNVTGLSNLTAEETVSIGQDAQGAFVNYNFKSNTKLTINIYNALGAVVESGINKTVLNKGRLSLNNLNVAKGVYSIEVLFDNKKIVRKMTF